MPGRIHHVVIFFRENHTFDNYFGTFPNANGVVLPAADPSANPPHDHKTWLSGAAVKGQYSSKDIPAYWSYAQEFTLCQNYFTDVASNSYPNHIFAIAATSPIINNPPAAAAPFNIDSLPLHLTKAGLDWRHYGTEAWHYLGNLPAGHGFSVDEFARHAAAGALPSVCWVYSPKGLSEHPPESVTDGSEWVARQVQAIVQGGLWSTTAIFITWDDWGGWFDHVKAPEVSTWPTPDASTDPSMRHREFDGTQFRYGNRVPCLVLSPFAKPRYLSSVRHSHASLVRFCESTFGLDPVNPQNPADDMKDCFDLSTTKPLPPPSYVLAGAVGEARATPSRNRRQGKPTRTG